LFAELSEARRQLLEQAAVLALVVRCTVWPKGCDMQFLGHATSVLERPTAAQLRSFDQKAYPLAFKGGPWELEDQHLRLSLQDS
jgi:hypothetical protein